MAIKAFSFLPILSVLLLAGVASASIEKVCTKAAAGGVINSDDCIEILKAAPGSSNADDRGLAVIAGHLGAAHAQETITKIQKLLKSGDSNIRTELETCKDLYDEAVDNMNTAADSAGKSHYDDANVYFSAAMTDATTCDDTFSDAKLASPLSKDDSKLYLLGGVGAAITNTQS